MKYIQTDVVIFYITIILIGCLEAENLDEPLNQSIDSSIEDLDPLDHSFNSEDLGLLDFKIKDFNIVKDNEVDDDFQFLENDMLMNDFNITGGSDSSDTEDMMGGMTSAGSECLTESCDGMDNDCDGLIDEDLDSNAPLATIQLGVCTGSQQRCIDGQWNEPSYEELALFEAVESTCDELDNDCDGDIDEASCQGVCGDGVIDEGEECDYGDNNSGEECAYGHLECDICTPLCTRIRAEYCGDGIINGPETCEQDQLDQGFLCTHQCLQFECGMNLSYTPLRIQGWPVCVNEVLISQNPTLYQQVIDALDEDLEYIQLILPEEPVEWLKRVNIWVELSTDRFSGGVYHPNPVWLSQNGYPEEWALGIQIGNAQNYMTWVREQPAIILHELTHAWHHQYLPYGYLPLINAYQSAMSAALYDSVEYVYGQNLEAYATTNVREYFAELTEAWFWSNDYYPFIRSELLLHDPTGADVIESAWQMNP